jgi:hypothetical protein
MEEVWFRPFVWVDYRLAVLFTVIIPIILLIWSLIAKSQAIQRLLIIYWRVASLLMITVYLMIPGWKIGFLTGLSARILIPISLWFWIDLNEEIRDLPASILKLVITSWRWAVTIYSTLGAIANIYFVSCAFSPTLFPTNYCQVWLETPMRYKDLFHANSTPGFLGFLGAVGLVFYALYFIYFICVRLGKQGRSAMDI